MNEIIVVKKRLRSKIIRRDAFTLAEVLITLGVIGVVAAITIPNFVSGYRERVNSEREANVAIKITNAMDLMRAHGLLENRYANTDEFVNELQKYLKISLRCDASNLTKCWPVNVVTNADGKEYNVANAKTGKHLGLSNNGTNNVGLVLADGTPIILTYNENSDAIGETDRIEGVTKKLPIGFGKEKDFVYTSSVTAPIAFVMDVNGKANPNMEKQGDANFKYDIRSFRGASFAKENLCGDNFKKVSVSYGYGYGMILDGDEGGTSMCLSGTSTDQRRAACRSNYGNYYAGDLSMKTAPKNASFEYYIYCGYSGGGGCLAKGTMITLADGSEKPIEDITYDDELLVWDFDEGKFASSKPVWLMQPRIVDKHILLSYSNGSQLKCLHRVFNIEAGKFAIPLSEDSLLGSSTILADGNKAQLVSQEEISEETVYYNIITEKHLNCFANGICTSNKFSNMYKIKDLKYVKTDREIVPYSEYEEYVSYDMYKKMRLGEIPKELISKQYLYSLVATQLPYTKIKELV